MAYNFRQSRFRRRDDIAEDVNPSAYIVNLADCMLVLACGFMVALMVFWNIDIANVEELKKESLEQVNPEEILDEIQGGGSYYVEAGTVYQDPNTGELWMVRKNDGGEAAGSDGSGGEAAGNIGNGATGDDGGTASGSGDSEAAGGNGGETANSDGGGTSHGDGGGSPENANEGANDSDIASSRAIGAD